jgi:hypothetical protein
MLKTSNFSLIRILAAMDGIRGKELVGLGCGTAKLCAGGGTMMTA